MPLSNTSFGDMFVFPFLENRNCASITAVGLIRWCHYMGESWCWLPVSNKVSFFNYTLIVMFFNFVFTFHRTKPTISTTSFLTLITNRSYVWTCSGHDCGVFVMVFMDLLSINGGVLCFSQSDMRQLCKKCLADLLAGEIRNFPIMSLLWPPCHAATKFLASQFLSPHMFSTVFYVYMIAL